MFDAVDMMYLNGMSMLSAAKEGIRKKVHDFWEEEKGGASTIVIEIVMIGMILVLGFIFRKQIAQLFSDLWNSLVIGKDTQGNTGITNEMANPFE